MSCELGAMSCEGPVDTNVPYRSRR
jgi:hypothetical protein